MNDIGRWHRAKMELFRKIESAIQTGIRQPTRDGLTDSVLKVVDEWFQKTIFEFQITQVVRKEVLRDVQDELHYEKFRAEQAAHKIAEELLKKQIAFTEIVSDSIYEKRIVTSILVVGTPQFIVSNKTGELRYVRD